MASRELLSYEDIVDVIREKRQELGVSIGILAQRTGIQPQRLQQIEQLQIDATYRTIFALMDTITQIEREETITAEQLMTDGVEWIDSKTTVEKARNIMYDNDYLQLPVKDQREQGTDYNIGSFTERHIESVQDMEKQVGAIMGPPLPEVAPGTIYRELQQLFQQGYSAALVVDNTGYIGIVTRTDMK